MQGYQQCDNDPTGCLVFVAILALCWWVTSTIVHMNARSRPLETDSGTIQTMRYYPDDSEGSATFVNRQGQRINVRLQENEYQSMRIGDVVDVERGGVDGWWVVKIERHGQ